MSQSNGQRQRNRERERGGERGGEGGRERGREGGGEGGGGWERERERDVSWLLNVPATCEVYLRDGSAPTILRAATLRWKLQIQLSISPSHRILTPGQPVPALTL